MSRITRQNRIFIEHIANGCSGAEAVRRAGYRAKQPPNTACFLLKREDILKCIQIKKDELAVKYAVTRDSLVRETITLQTKTSDEKIVRDCIRLKAEITGNIKSHESKQTIIVVNAQESAILSRYARDQSRGKDTNALQPPPQGL